MALRLSREKEEAVLRSMVAEKRRIQWLSWLKNEVVRVR